MNIRRLVFAGVAVAVVGGVVVGTVIWGRVTAPVPGTPCVATTLAAIEARGQSFHSSFFTSQYTMNGMLVGAVRDEPYPDCYAFLSAMRCTTDGPTTVGARLYNASAYFDIPAGATATLTISDGAGIACGQESGPRP